MSTNFITPNELKQQQEKIARRKRMAELIRASAATPIESPGVAGAKTSPWQVLIKALQGGIGGYEESQANKEEKALLARQDAAEENANTQFAAGQYPYAPQEPIPQRSPDNFTPTETFTVPDSLTPHQAPEMLPGADQAQYLASIAPTVTSQIPEQVPGREMPPPPPMQFGSPSQQRAAEFLDEMRRSPLAVQNSAVRTQQLITETNLNQERIKAAKLLAAEKRLENLNGKQGSNGANTAPETLGIPPGVDPAEYLASSAPTVTSQIPEQVPGREMPPPPNYIQSLVAALGQNKKSNEYVDQRRLALANVLNSKDPNKIKFMFDQMGSREQFEQQRQLASEQAGYGLTAAELKYLRDVETAKTQADVNKTAASTLADVNKTAASTQADVNKTAASTQAGVREKTASDLAKVNKDAASTLAGVREKTVSDLAKVNKDKVKAQDDAKLLAKNAQIAQDESLNSNQSEAFLKAPAITRTAVINNQGLMDDIEEAIAFLNDPAIDDSMSLASLAIKSLSNRLIPENAVKIYSKLSSIASKQVLDMTGKASSEAETKRFRGFTPNVSGGFFGSGADTKGSAITKLTQYYEALKRYNDLIGRTYNFTTTSGRPQEVAPEIWWNYSQKDKDDYVPAPPGSSPEELEEWRTFPNETRLKIQKAGK